MCSGRCNTTILKQQAAKAEFTRSAQWPDTADTRMGSASQPLPPGPETSAPKPQAFRRLAQALRWQGCPKLKNLLVIFLSRNLMQICLQ